MRATVTTIALIGLTIGAPDAADAQQWTDSTNAGLTQKMSNSPQNYSGMGDGSFEVIGELPGLNRMPSINEADNQCVSATYGRAVGYLGNRNAPDATKDFSAQDWAADLHEALGGKLVFSAKKKKQKHKGPPAGPDGLPPACGKEPLPLPPEVLVNLPLAPGSAGEETVVGGTNGGGAATESGSGSGGVAPGGAAPGGGSEGGVSGSFSGDFMSAKHKALGDVKKPWTAKIKSTIIKKRNQKPTNYGAFLESLARDMKKGIVIEVRVTTGAAQTSTSAGAHATTLGKVLKFSNGNYGLVFVDDATQGDGKASNYLRGPYIFDKDGKCLSKPGMKILEVMSEEWVK